jgi:hypothetical protein
MLEYSRVRDQSPASKLKWIIVAVAVMAACGLLSHVINFVLYFFPSRFRGVGTSLADGGKTDWQSMAVELGSSALTIWLLASAIAFLRGAPARRMLVWATWTTVLVNAGGIAWFYFKYVRNRPGGDQVIECLWNAVTFVQYNLTPALLLVFFGARGAPVRLAELAAPVASAAAVPPPDRTPDSPSLERE